MELMKESSKNQHDFCYFVVLVVLLSLDSLNFVFQLNYWFPLNVPCPPSSPLSTTTDPHEHANPHAAVTSFNEVTIHHTSEGCNRRIPAPKTQSVKLQQQLMQPSSSSTNDLVVEGQVIWHEWNYLGGSAGIGGNSHWVCQLGELAWRFFTKSFW